MHILTILATAVSGAFLLLGEGVNIPSAGLAIYSEKLGDDRRFFYRLQIRLYPRQEYGLVVCHSSGHCRVEGGSYCRVEAVVEALLQYRRGYYDAQAAAQTDAIEAYYDALRCAA